MPSQRQEPVHFSDLQQRLSGHIYSLYMNYSFLIKGGVYTVASMSLFHILTENEAFQKGRFGFWLASFGLSVVTIAKWSRGSVMAAPAATMLDVLLPIAIGIPEYLLFIVLDPMFTLSWTYWYVVAAIHSALALALVGNRLKQTKTSHYDPELLPLVEKYKKWMWRDLLGAGIIAAISSVLFLATRPEFGKWAILHVPGAELRHTVIAALYLVVGIWITRQAYFEYLDITTFSPKSEQVATAPPATPAVNV